MFANKKQNVSKRKLTLTLRFVVVIDHGAQSLLAQVALAGARRVLGRLALLVLDAITGLRRTSTHKSAYEYANISVRVHKHQTSEVTCNHQPVDARL